MASIITIRLNKSPGSSWGFRLQGGKDFATPLCIQKVNVGSVAAQAGLQAGDAIVSIGGNDALAFRHKEAQDAIVKAGHNFELVVQRGSQIWKPTVTPLPETKVLSDGIPVATKTSLAANQKTYRPPASGHNSSAAPFQLVNAQYNSPVNIYSEDSIAETLSAQAEVLGKGGVLGINFKKYNREEKIRTDSPTYKLLHGEEEERKPRPISMHNASDSVPFQRDVTQDQKGYYNISDKLYCDIHAKQAARSNPPAPNFEPITVPPGVAPPSGVMTAPQASRMKIPSAFQQGGPAPVPVPAPAPAPAPPQTEVQQPEHQEFPEPIPAPVFEPIQIPLAVSEVTSQSQLSSQIVEHEEVVLPPTFNGGTFASQERAPAPAPAPIKPFVPAPAPAPVVAAPLKLVSAPSYSTSANPQGFGAPAGDINVRAHIPKKGQRFEWPPSRITPVVEEEPHPPAWAPAGEIPSILRPVKPAGPLPKRPPLLPTPPPPKDYDVIVMKSLSSSQLQSIQETVHQTVQQSVQESVQKTVQKSSFQSSQSRSVPAPKPLSQQAPPPPAASRFPKPAPALINLTSVSSSSASKTSHSASKTSHSASPKITPKPKSTGPVSNTASATPKGSVNVSRKKISISPPKAMPITTPMPSLKFDSVPKLSDSKPIFPKPSAVPSSLPQQKHQQQQPKKHQESAIAGFKSVSAPSQIQNPTIDGGYKTVKVSEITSVETSFVKSNLPASAPALSENVVPKPVPSTPPAPAGDVPAPMTFAPAPAPAPIPNFGSNTMPKPVPPPGIGGKIGPGGPPARGVPQAPGQRSAPRRGRGVMNQASASRIPVCNACQRQIRGPFVSALGKTWCPDHFICATTTCKRNIIDMGFVEEKGLLYCENCYESFLAPICGKCDKRIKGDCLNAVGKQFHPECFCCAYCGKVFGSGAFYLEDGLPYCETDWNDLFTTKCVGCNFPIEAGDRWVEALNNNYHSQCFKCSKCHKNLEGQSFFAKGGKPFCKAHAQRGF